jgi:hypothetical protein
MTCRLCILLTLLRPGSVTVMSIDAFDRDGWSWQVRLGSRGPLAEGFERLRSRGTVRNGG